MKQIFTLLAFLLCGVLGYSQIMKVTQGSSVTSINGGNTPVSLNAVYDYAGATTLSFTVLVTNGTPTAGSKIWLNNGSTTEELSVVGGEMFGGVWTKTFTIGTAGGDITVVVGGNLNIMYDENGSGSDIPDSEDRILTHTHVP
ncbi:MAG: hypothetical protein GY705_09560, partial [Bacteroidetes bacterium]|nr:hypothetical protein [Bacteroidota bacterium]